MSLIVLTLLQAASGGMPGPAPAAAPPLAYMRIAMAGGGVAFTVATLSADKLSEVQDLLDAAAAKNCGGKSLIAGDQSYDQTTDSNGNAAPTITTLRMT